MQLLSVLLWVLDRETTKWKMFLWLFVFDLLKSVVYEIFNVKNLKNLLDGEMRQRAGYMKKQFPNGSSVSGTWVLSDIMPWINIIRSFILFLNSNGTKSLRLYGELSLYFLFDRMISFRWKKYKSSIVWSLKLILLVSGSIWDKLFSVLWLLL